MYDECFCDWKTNNGTCAGLVFPKYTHGIFAGVGDFDLDFISWHPDLDVRKGGSSMAFIEAKDYRFFYPDEVEPAVFVEQMEIKQGTITLLVGPSGCGKTTTLRIIGGFETPDKGQVLFDGKDITALPPNERDLNTVFQKYALFPHMSIAENIAFGLKIRKKARHTSTTKSNTP